MLLYMTDEIEDKKSAVTEAIRRNISILNAIVVFVLFSILILNIILNYVQTLSLLKMLLIVLVLIAISLFAIRYVSRGAIKELERYDDKLNVLLISLQNEINERKLAEEKLKKAYSELEDQIKGHSAG